MPSFSPLLKITRPKNTGNKNIIKVTRGHWHSFDNQRKEVEKIFKNVNLEEEWQKYTHLDLLSLGMGKLLRIYKGSFFRLLKALYPYKKWNVLDHRRLPKNYWASLHNQRLFLEDIYHKLNFNTLDDFLSLTTKDIINFGGSRLVNKNKSSFFLTLRRAYPNHCWEIQKRIYQSPNHWESVANQRTFFDYFYNKYGFTSMEQWYSVKNANIREEKGASLLRIYGSLFRALQVAYPEYSWDIYRSSARKTKHFEDPENIRNFILRVMRIYSVEREDDWYRISRRQIKRSGGGNLLYSKGMFRILSDYFPTHKWDKSLLIERSKKAEQRYLFVLAKKLFPAFNTYEDYDHPKLEFPGTDYMVEIDVMIPELNIGIEYNGAQHFDELLGAFSPIEEYQGRDQMKVDLCRLQSISLITIPYWWDRCSLTLSRLIDSCLPK